MEFTFFQFRQRQLHIVVVEVVKEKVFIFWDQILLRFFLSGKVITLVVLLGEIESFFLFMLLCYS